MITFGLTGSIACGKSNITKIFRANDIPMVDADIIARQVVVPGALGYRKLIHSFGRDILDENGDLKRGTFAKLIFNDPDAREKLNEIMFPLISKEAQFQISLLHKRYPIVGYDCALIIESGEANNFRPLVVAHCAPKLQLERLMSRNTLTRDEAMARIHSQLPTEKKIKFADYTIDTSFSIAETANQVLEVIQKLRNIQ